MRITLCDININKKGVEIGERQNRCHFRDLLFGFRTSDQHCTVFTSQHNFRGHSCYIFKIIFS